MSFCAQCNSDLDDPLKPGHDDSDQHEEWCPFMTGYSKERWFVLRRANHDCVWAADEILKLRDALAELIYLKDWKDKYGKDRDYQRMMPLAWAKAKDALGDRCLPDSAEKEPQ